MRLEGRKAWVEGTIESLGTIHQEKEPIVYARAEGLIIEPKYAAIMKVSFPKKSALIVNSVLC